MIWGYPIILGNIHVEYIDDSISIQQQSAVCSKKKPPKTQKPLIIPCFPPFSYIQVLSYVSFGEGFFGRIQQLWHGWIDIQPL